jgi:hypothetical protein
MQVANDDTTAHGKLAMPMGTADETYFKILVASMIRFYNRRSMKTRRIFLFF